MEELTELVDFQSYVSTDHFRSYNFCVRHFNGHGVVNHSHQFLNPVREEEPLCVPAGRFAPECLDKQWVGPPTIPGHVPFRDHTQNIERCWRDLKSLIVPSTKENVVYLYLGECEWMYRKNVLNRIDTFAGQMERFMHDIRRAYPGLGRRPMQLDIRDCDCHECEP
ncbi:signal recognition particle 54k protein srp54 [Holotrichia oblita]|uniref:Signal recognition particle 54k protein srp54 n=1 Tax=Holotrichia oblita TaxID=644536 RepID=A0ACB9TW39_HOLOL|nr:signal recognition particle 54k protein srp54 [Holotrichia oblita]